MKIISFIILLFFLTTCKNKNNDIEKKSNNYIVNKIKGKEIIVDGIINKDEWDNANNIANFVLPWENIEAQPTEFKALYDAQKFYFSFSVIDTEIVVLDSIETKEDLVYEDRVEIYFAFDYNLKKPYYCVEIDPKGYLLDYQATFPRHFNFEVSWGSIESAAVRTDSGYTVEASISLDDMKNLGYKINGDKTELKVAVFRADFEKANSDSLIKHWQAWIAPNVSEPDYHVQSSFGDFIFRK